MFAQREKEGKNEVVFFTFRNSSGSWLPRMVIHKRISPDNTFRQKVLIKPSISYVLFLKNELTVLKIMLHF